MKKDYTTKFKAKNEVTHANTTNVFEFFTKLLFEQIDKNLWYAFSISFQITNLAYLNQIQISKTYLSSFIVDASTIKIKTNKQIQITCRKKNLFIAYGLDLTLTSANLAGFGQFHLFPTTLK